MSTRHGLCNRTELVRVHKIFAKFIAGLYHYRAEKNEPMRSSSG